MSHRTNVRSYQYELQSPCLDCSDRKMGCHADCRRYAVYKQELEKIKDKRRADRNLGLSEKAEKKYRKKQYEKKFSYRGRKRGWWGNE